MFWVRWVRVNGINIIKKKFNDSENIRGNTFAFKSDPSRFIPKCLFFWGGHWATYGARAGSGPQSENYRPPNVFRISVESGPRMKMTGPQRYKIL